MDPEETKGMFLMFYVGIPLFILMIGTFSGDRRAFQGGVQIACGVEIIFSTIFFACMAFDALPPLEMSFGGPIAVLCLVAILIIFPYEKLRNTCAEEPDH